MNDRVLAAGGVLWRSRASGPTSPDAVEVVGVFRPQTGNWSLPKGKLDDGEHPLSGACREVAEETGLSPVPQTFLARASYQLPRGDGCVDKIVDFWSMRALDDRAAFVPNAEVTQQRWFPLAEAEKVLDRPRDQDALSAFRALPPVTATVLLLRHARAASASHAETDAARPLDAVGRGDSARLVPLLALYQPPRVLAATPVRCADTVIPAAALGVPVESEPVFDAEAYPHDPEGAAARLRELAVSGGGVVCSQAPVIADCLAILADTDGIAMPDVHTPTGGVWVLSFSRKTLVAAQRLSP